MNRIFGLLPVLAIAILVSAPHAVAQSATAQAGANGNHSCALGANGGVRCWGRNDEGQLGNASTSDSSVPVSVSGLSSGVVAVALGAFHSCALTTAGGVKCWGQNTFGQLGITSADSSTPVSVTGLSSGVVAIAAGSQHTCALTTAGGVKCWGYNLYGQLGDGTNGSRATPADVSGLTSGAVALSSGYRHSCVLDANGAAKCWGLNDNGQLGNGTLALNGTNGEISTPVNVVGVGPLAAITTGNGHTCALTTAGAAQCWGANDLGQLGNGTSGGTSLSPVGVSGLGTNVARIASGAAHVCAITTDGKPKCWGGNGSGQLGNGSVNGAGLPTPVDVSGLGGGIAAISGGVAHTCALTVGGTVRCWGSNGEGQLGDNTLVDRLVQTNVSTFTSGTVSTHVTAGATHSCALTAGGGVQCWGNNSFLQLADGTEDPSSIPVAAQGVASGVAAIATGTDHNCALTTGGGLKCWGAGVTGQLGVGADNSSTPLDVPGLTSGVLAVVAGGFHTCALTTAGGVKCWGDNTFGQLGDGTNVSRAAPQDVLGLTSGIVALSSGYEHTCALDALGAAKCWGLNDNGQLGNGTLALNSTNGSVNTPVVVVGVASALTRIAAGGLHTCAITTAGAAKCWGFNGLGQLGNGSPGGISLAPVDVSGLSSNVTMIATGGYHTCALDTGGFMRCWGDNGFGQLGDDTNNERDTPTLVSGLAGSVASFATGVVHTCVLTTGGSVRCWGRNVEGEAGDNTVVARTMASDALVGQQTIAFSAPASVVFASSTPLVATALSRRTVAFDTWTSGTCSISGGNLVAGGVGLCEVRARQAGNADYFAAPQQSRLLFVTFASQSIGFGALAGRTFGDAPFTVSATGGGSTSPVTFSSLTTGVCTTGGTNGATVAIIAAGSCTIAADQAGDANYTAAPQVTRTFNVAKANQVITFGALANTTFGETFTLTATGGGSSSAVTFSTTSSACSITGTTVTAIAPGTCTIAADQAGDANYNAAPQVTRSFTVNMAGQAITFGPLGNKNLGDAPFTVSATGGGSGNAVTFSSLTSLVCTTSGTNGSTVTLAALGTCTIAADQAGDGNYNAAPQVTSSFQVLDATPPDTTITSSPAALSNSATATFTFTSTEAGTFECLLDAAAFTTCTTPKVYTSLAGGAHSFAVRAIDLASNVDPSPATFNWTVDTSPPDTTITSSPTTLSNSATATFNFTSTEAGTFECSLDAAAFGACATPKVYTGLADGAHSFAVRAIDLASNVDPSPATFSWTIDATAPTLAITGKTVITAANQAAYSISGTCSEDGRAVSAQIGSIAASATCGTPASGRFATLAVDVSALAQGVVSLSASITDAAGNTTSVTDSTTKDTVGPTLIIDALDAITNANKSAYSFSGTCEPTGGAVGYTLTSGASINGSATCAGGGTYVVSAVDVTTLTDGTVSFTLTQADSVGNTTTTNGSTTKDTVNPTLTFDTLGVANAANQAAYAITGTCSEAGRAVNITVASTVTAAPLCGTPGPGVFTATVDLSAIADGTLTVSGTHLDAAGNSASASTSITKDSTAPAPPVITAPIGTVASAQPTVTGTAEALSTITVVLDGATAGTTSADAGGAWGFALPDPLTLGHTLRASATDTAGNTSALSTAVAFFVARVVSVNPATLPDGTVVVAYSQNASGSGGLAPYSFAVTSGTLPTGLALSSAGVLSGPPSVAGPFSFTITATDTDTTNGPFSGSRAYTITIAKADQAITFGALGNKTFGDAPFTVSATGGGSGNALTFSSLTTGACTSTGTNGTTIAIVGTGGCTIAADQAGNANYNAAPQVTRSFTVGKANQAITFGALGNKTFGDAPFTVSATGGGSANSVTFSSFTTSVCTSTGTNGTTITIVAAGLCTIAADQAGNANYNAAPQVTRSFTIGKANQAITFGALGNKTFGDAPFTVSATGGASGNAVTFSSLTAAVCSSTGPNGTTITIVAAGPCTIAANQAGDANYDPAPQVTRSFVVGTLDTTPNVFTFVDQTNIAPGSVVTSNTVTIAGIDSPAPITVTGGAYSIGCTTTFVAAAATITNGQTVCVRHTAPFGLSATTNTTLTVGGVSDTFSSTTVATLDPAGDADSDGIPNGVELVEGRNPLVKDNDVFGNARLFSMQQYRDFLGREGDANGITSFTNFINGGGTRAAVTEGFFGSSEFQGTGSPVVRLYFAYFLRIPDYGGLTFWMGYFRAGHSLVEISDAFAQSPEFTSRYGALTNDQFVDLVYQNVLDRPADASGKAFWLGQLNGGMSRGTMMTGFSESAEFKAAIYGETYVTMMYVGMLKREPDSGGFTFWVNYLNGGNSGQALINGFLVSQEYHNRFLP